MKLGAAGVASLFFDGANPINLAAPTLPEKPIRLGQGVFFVMPTLKNVVSDVQTFEEALGHRAQGLSFFADLDRKPPTARMIESTFASGRAVMINLQPRPSGDALDSRHIFAPKAFIRGDHDKTLMGLARMMKSFEDIPIFVRFAFEMNCTDWFSWCGNADGFINMWRHTVDVFKQAGAQNVKWIFSPGYLPYPETIGNYYPGKDYVDVVGADVYDWEGLSPAFALNRINFYLRQIAPDKPLIVSELGAAGARKDEWVADAIIKSLSQGASAINYFQINKEKDWKIEKGSKIPELRKIANSGVFLSNNANLQKINETILTVN